MNRANSIISFLIFLLIFVIYARGVAPSVYGGDSGDVILAAWFGGVAHPPGYPLNTMLGWVFTHLPYEATVAFKANLLAAFFHAAVIGVFYLIVERLTKNVFVSIVSSLILAFNPLFWLYSHVLEVFQLNLLIVSASIYFLICWRDSVLNKKENTKKLNFAVFLAGLAVFHHHTSVLLAPAYFYLILKTKKKTLVDFRNLFKLGLIFLLGILPYIFIPFAAIRQTPINWDNPTNLSNFIRLITRGDYGTFTAAGFLVGADLKQKVFQLINLFLFMKSDFTIVGLILVVFGGVWSFLKKRQEFFFTLISFLMVGPFFLIYSSFPTLNSFYTGLWERFILIAYFFASIYVAFGLLFFNNFLFNLMRKGSLRIAKSALVKLSVFALFLTLPLFLFRTNLYKADMHGFYMGDWIGSDILTSAKDNSVVFVFGDTTSFNAQYVYYTQDENRNIKLIKGGSLNQKEYREQIVREFQGLVFPKDFLTTDEKYSDKYLVSLMGANKDVSEIYALDVTPQIDGFEWTSSGLLKRLVPKEEYGKDLVEAENKKVFSKFLFQSPDQDLSFEHYIPGHIKEIYARAYLDVADELVQNGDRNNALVYLTRGMEFAPLWKEPYIKLGNIYFSKNDCENSKKYFEMAFERDKKEWKVLEALSKVYGECFGDFANAQLYKNRSEELKNKIFGNPL